MASKGSPKSVQGNPKRTQGELQRRPRELKRGPGGPQEVSRGLQMVPYGAPGNLKGYQGYEKPIREVQVLYCGLCIERIVFEVWIPRFICQVLYSKFYIRGVLYSKVSIPGVYSKFHILGFLILALYSKFKARWRGGRRQLDKM